MTHLSASSRLFHRLASVIAAALASIFLLFLVAPIAELIGAGGGSGLRKLTTDVELRSSLWLTLVAATSAVVCGVAGGTPIAYLLARRRFRGRAVLSAVLDLPLLIPHPVAGIALLLVLGRGSVAGQVLLDAGVRAVVQPGGSVRDEEVVKAADEFNIAMVFTGKRQFRH